MKDHLLSIFPLQGMGEYARVSCIALGDNATDCAEPFTTLQADLLQALARAFPPEEFADIQSKLEECETVQMQITAEQATSLGFLPKSN